MQCIRIHHKQWFIMIYHDLSKHLREIKRISTGIHPCTPCASYISVKQLLNILCIYIFFYLFHYVSLILNSFWGSLMFHGFHGFPHESSCIPPCTPYSSYILWCISLQLLPESARTLGQHGSAMRHMRSPGHGNLIWDDLKL